MTKFRLLDAINDWTFGFGNQGFAQNVPALMYDIGTRLRSWIGDCFFDMQMGVDWKNFLGSLGSQDELIIAIKRVILKTPGVLRINSINVDFSSEERNIDLTFNIDSVYQNNVSGEFELFTSYNNIVSVFSVTTYIPIDASAGPATQLVPTAVGASGTELVYKKIDNSENPVILTTISGQTIDGQTTYNLTAQNEVIRILSNNLNWEISGKL